MSTVQPWFGELGAGLVLELLLLGLTLRTQVIAGMMDSRHFERSGSGDRKGLQGHFAS